MADIKDYNDLVSFIGIEVDVSDNSTPEWQYLCSMNARAFNLSRGEETTDIVAECGPGASVETWRAAGALDWTITGEAALELDTFDLCREWIMDGSQKNMRITMFTGDRNDPGIHGYFEGMGILLEYPIDQASAGEIPRANISISKGMGTLKYTAGEP